MALINRKKYQAAEMQLKTERDMEGRACTPKSFLNWGRKKNCASLWGVFLYEKKWRWFQGSFCLSCFSKLHLAPPPSAKHGTRTHSHRRANTDSREDERLVRMRGEAPSVNVFTLSLKRNLKAQQKPSFSTNAKQENMQYKPAHLPGFKIIVSLQLLPLQKNNT